MTFKRVEKDWDTARSALRIHSIRQIAVQYEGTDERVISRVPDVSTSGMFINTSRKYAEGAVLNLSFCLALSDWKCKRAAKSAIPFPESASACNLLTSARTRFVPSSRKPGSRAAFSPCRAKRSVANQFAASPLRANNRSPKPSGKKTGDKNPLWIYLLRSTPLFCTRRIMPSCGGTHHV
jgi:hypothetical protein